MRRGVRRISAGRGYVRRFQSRVPRSNLLQASSQDKTALGVLLRRGFPGLPAWAKLFRAYGAWGLVPSQVSQAFRRGLSYFRAYGD